MPSDYLPITFRLPSRYLTLSPRFPGKKVLRNFLRNVPQHALSIGGFQGAIAFLLEGATATIDKRSQTVADKIKKPPD